ncbi:MAG: asparagine synthase (glutamine-hydrolyzing), partial [Planctomycetota bacterium]
MCGIAGALALPGSTRPIDEPSLTRMRERLAHRGPDGRGTWVSPDGRVGLAHRRLAIIDLSPAADQPMATEDERFWICFNGEIYNHAALRESLEELGEGAWRTDHSDTEVALRAFRRWGIECLDRLHGMFALAIWDARERSLLLARDRVGIKPLYYSLRPRRFTFASEIKALLEDPEQQRAIDEEAFLDLLSFLTTPAPRTLFRGICKLPAGHWLRIDDEGRIEERCWWDPLERAEPLAGVGEEEVAERVLERLREAVALRKVSDVPVGVFLSGGIDSSTNAALFSEGETRPVRTFSIGYDRNYESYTNELVHAREAARQVGAEHHERILSADDLLEFLPEMVDLQDEPIADPVCVPVYYVSRLAREHGVKVCQVGEGADELFWGYPAWKRALALERWNRVPVPRTLKRGGLAALRLLGRDQTRYYEWLRRGSAGEAVFWGGAEGFTEAQKARIIAPRLREAFAGRPTWLVLEPHRKRF